MLLLIVFNAQPVAEGFKSIPRVSQGNYVLDLLGNLTRTSRALADPLLWKERMELMGKSPVELAREYIKKQRATD